MKNDGVNGSMVVVKKEMSLAKTLELGGVFAASGMFSDIQSKNQAAVKIMAGRELGIPAIVSMSKIFMVSGKVALPAEIMGGLIKKSGKYNYRVLKHDEELCEIQFFEKEDNKWIEIGKSKFTMNDAKLAKLTAKDNWQNYRRNMLFSRALSNGARWYCPDAIQGAYTTEELNVVETTAEPGIEDKIADAKGKAESGAETPLKGEVVENGGKPSSPPEKAVEQQATSNGELPTGKDEPKLATLEKLKELTDLIAKLPGEDVATRKKVYNALKMAVKIETPDEELTAAQVVTLIQIVKHNIPKGEVVDAEVPEETPEPPKSDCPAGHCVACFAAGGKKKKVTVGALKLSKKMGKEPHCFKCLQAANK